MEILRCFVDGPEVGRQEATSDTRPETSPYGGNSIRIEFRGGSLTITEGLLRKYPKLSSHLQNNGDYWHTDSSSADMLRIPLAAGHVIVHYLFTGNYESLRPIGASPEEKYVAEFTTAIQVYIHARKYELEPLERLASREVTRLGQNLSATQVLHVVKGEYSDPDLDDVWFASYVKRQMQSLSENPELLLGPDVLESIVGDVAVTKFIVKAAFEVFYESMESKKLAERAAEAEGPISPLRDLTPPWERVPTRQTTTENDGSNFESIPSEQPGPEPELAPEMEPGPKSELQRGNDDEDDFWSSFKTKKGRKNKKLVSVIEPELLEEPSPEPVPVEEEDVWGFTRLNGSKKKQKKSATAMELEPVREPETEPAPEPAPMGEWDVWGLDTLSGGKKKKKKKKKGGVSATFSEFEPAEEPRPEPVEESVPKVEALPAEGRAEEGISGFARPKRNKRPRNTVIWDCSCEDRAEHILDGDAWKECDSCREFLRERASQLGGM